MAIINTEACQELALNWDNLLKKKKKKKITTVKESKK